MEQMKADYKTRMMDARHQKLSEEQRKEALNRARNGITRPFGSTCMCLVVTPFPPQAADSYALQLSLPSSRTFGMWSPNLLTMKTRRKEARSAGKAEAWSEKS